MKIRIIFFAVIIVILSCNIFANHPDTSQVVYFSAKSFPKVYKRVKELKDKGKSDQEIVFYFIKEEKIFKELNPELAKLKFGIEWRDNIPLEKVKFSAQSRQVKYPAVAICYLGTIKAGYGLVALEPIKQGDCIAEFTGLPIKDYEECESRSKNNPYFISYFPKGKQELVCVDAREAGNVARFTQGLLTKKYLDLFQYEFHDESIKENDIITSNALIIPLVETQDVNNIPIKLDDVRGNDFRFILKAARDIKPFEIIGSVDRTLNPSFYTFKESAGAPLLFTKDGTLIPKNKYQVQRKIVLFRDNLTGAFAEYKWVQSISGFDSYFEDGTKVCDYAHAIPVSDSKDITSIPPYQCVEILWRNDNYKVRKIPEKYRFIVDFSILREQISTPGNYIINVPVYTVRFDENSTGKLPEISEYDGFVDILEEFKIHQCSKKVQDQYLGFAVRAPDVALYEFRKHLGSGEICR